MMYEEYYGFRATPFTRGIPASDLYLPPRLEEVLGRLKYTAERQLFAVLTGDSGCGKTTLLRKFRDSLDGSRYKFLYIADSKLTPRGFYRVLLEQMGYTASYYRGDAKRQLHEQVAIMKGVYGVQPVCVCDECHLMSYEMLEEIRFLLNVDLDSVSPMGLVLSGQTELWKRLQLQKYAAIRQRIDLQSVINHYDRSETGAYISRQLEYAGASGEIFTQAAIDVIQQYTAGTARMIDKVCTSLLLYGCQSRMKLIDDHAVKLILENEFT